MSLYQRIHGETPIYVPSEKPLADKMGTGKSAEEVPKIPQKESEAQKIDVTEHYVSRIRNRRFTTGFDPAEAAKSEETPEYIAPEDLPTIEDENERRRKEAYAALYN